MLQVGAFEAENTLGSLLDRVEKGEEVPITRHGKPVAQLVAPRANPPVDRETAMAAYARLRTTAKRLQLGAFDREEYKKDRDEGRP